MAYTTNTSLKTYLDISGSGDDALLTALIARAQQMIDDAFAGIVFEATANTDRTFDAQRDVDGRVLYLDYPLVSINSITNGDGDVLTTSEYTTEPRNRTPYYAIRLLPSSGLYWQSNSSTGDYEDSITISGKWAWSTGADNTIVQMTIRLAAYLYRQRDNSADLDRPLFVNNATVLPTELPRDVNMMIKQHPAYHWMASG